MDSKNTPAQVPEKILIVCGSTAVGKTKLGIYLAKKFNGEIISADSRQVYKFMDIGTGKEWGNPPIGETSIPIHGYDLVDPKENYSVHDYLKFAEEKLKDIWSRNKLPILVGGTGLYIKAIVDGIETINIPSNNDLRKSLDVEKVDDLFEKLATLDSSKAASLNSSDKKNPRRLIRAIEIAIWKIENEKKVNNTIIADKNINTLFIGLKCSIKIISDLIYKRVEKRIEEGFIDEVEELLKNGVSWKMQSMNALGYKDSEGFFKYGLSYEEFVNNWHSNELKYVKRQITWFNKDKRINWFDITNKNYYLEVEKLVDKWDNNKYGTKS